MTSGGQKKRIRVLELFSGIGGMHFALKKTNLDFEIVAAYEIHPLLLESYRHNFAGTPAVNRNIENVTPEELNSLQIDLIAMSPPCQPFCRNGHKKDTADARTAPLNHLTRILPSVTFKYLLLENVVGFEGSEASIAFKSMLQSMNFTWREFLLNPTSLGIPNSRPRYYLLAKQASLPWPVPSQSTLITDLGPYITGNEALNEIVTSERSKWSKVSPFCIGDILEDPQAPSTTEFPIDPTQFQKYYTCLDIVTPESTNSNCFTKSYGSYLKGTGSLLQIKQGSEVKASNFRYFTPKEASRLLCFPPELTFPPNMSILQQYKALGNSLNVYIVSLLFQILFT